MKTIFQGNTGKQTLLERTLLNVIAPEPTNAYMDVHVLYDSEKKQYKTHYFMDDILVGTWVTTIKDRNVERKYFPCPDDLKELMIWEQYEFGNKFDK